MSMSSRIWDTAAAGYVGAKTAAALAELDIKTVGDLLRYYPRRYERLDAPTPFDALVVGETVTVQATVKKVRARRMQRRKGWLCEAVVTDDMATSGLAAEDLMTGAAAHELRLTFFDRSGWRENELRPGRRGLFAGKVDTYQGKGQLVHPDYQLFDDAGTAKANAKSEVTFSGGLIPIYPATKQLRSWHIAAAVRVALDVLDERLDQEDPLPHEVRRRHGLLGLRQALEQIHRPESFDDVAAARKRLRFEEAFVLQTELARRRAAVGAMHAKPRLPVFGGLLADFDARLPFELTAGQREVSEAIFADLARPRPMHRLLQGDVGSGKTVVALRAMLAVVDAGGQAALLAPTEVLAQQHYRLIRELLGPLAERGMLGGAEHGTQVALVTGSMGAKARRTTLIDVVCGDAGIVVGTHALFQEKVTFGDLGLVVIDEQHRFGVEQRAALVDKALDTPPHVLVMTATPIPRTVAMTVFGDLEVSTLTELPAGRQAIQTTVVPTTLAPRWVDRTWARVREEVEQGRQVYLVCPRIGDESDNGGDGHGSNGGEYATYGIDTVGPDEPRPAAAVLEVTPMLAEGPLAGLRVEMLHGRMPADAKDQVMRRFTAGEIDVLVATTVIEVGVDVPNASVMVIMDADRFGMSQLHQLRGRVGRGGHPGLCLLLSDAEDDSPAGERLRAVASTLDGFELSRLDLEQRREGDVLGVGQSGRRSSLRMLGVLRDENVIRQAREDATDLVTADLELSTQPALRAEVEALVEAQRADYLDKS